MGRSVRTRTLNSAAPWHEACFAGSGRDAATVSGDAMSTTCAITGLFHVLVKTNDLPLTLKFYKDVLGLREAPRPAFGNPGAWMAVSTPIGEQIIHVWAG